MEELNKLVMAAQGGDQDAFGQIVARFQDMAYAVGYAMLGEAGLAQDAAQDAFIDAYLCLPTLREPAAFPGWFRRVIVKHSDRQIRRERVITIPFDDALAIASPLPDPADVVEEHELQESIQAAIASLPPNQRLITTLFYLDGYSQKEIEEFLELPISTIKKSLFTARKGLKERMASMVQEIRDHRPSQTDQFALKVNFFIALKTGDLRRVKTLVEQNPDLIQIKTEWGFGSEGYYWPVGYTALHWAAATADDPLFSFLLSRGADVNALTPGGMTPLHIAVLMRQKDIAHRLLTGAPKPDVNVQSKTGIAPLHLAAMRDDVELAELLLKHGANINIADKGGRTPIQWAAIKGSSKLIEGLAMRGGLPVSAASAVGGRFAPGPVFETGLKLTDLFAPFKRGGHNGVFTPLNGVGRAVVLSHLIQIVATRDGGHTICLSLEDEVYTAKDLKLTWREWGVEEEVTLLLSRAEGAPQAKLNAVKEALASAEELRSQGREVLLMMDGQFALAEGALAYLKANVRPTTGAAITVVYYGPYSVGAEPPPFADLDAVLTFDYARAKQGLWPAIDPLRSWSRWTGPETLGDRHVQLAAQARRLLSRYHDFHPVVENYGLDLLADVADRQTVLRARRLHRFLTQPLPGAEPWTNLPGEQVSLAQTLKGCEAILNGQHDDLPEEAFYFAGAIEQVVEKAKRL